MAVTETVATAAPTETTGPLAIPAPPTSAGLVAQSAPVFYPGNASESLVAYNTPSNTPGEFFEQVAGTDANGNAQYFWSNPEAGVATPWSADSNAGLNVLEGEFPGWFTPPAAAAAPANATTSTPTNVNSASPPAATATSLTTGDPASQAALLSSLENALMGGAVTGGGTAGGTTVPSDQAAIEAASPNFVGAPTTTNTGANSAGEVIGIMLLIGVVVGGFLIWHHLKHKHSGLATSPAPAATSTPPGDR